MLELIGRSRWQTWHNDDDEPVTERIPGLSSAPPGIEQRLTEKAMFTQFDRGHDRLREPGATQAHLA